MKFKHDLEMWHTFKEFAVTLQQLADFNEIRLIGECVMYEYDRGACEEYCHHPKVTRVGDFRSHDECWKCLYYLGELPKEKKKKVSKK